MEREALVPALLLALTAAAPSLRADLLELPETLPDRRLAACRKAIDELHAAALRSKKPWTEEALRKRLPRSVLALDARLAKERAEPKAKALALAHLALIWAELAWVERIAPLREAIEKLDPETANRLGHFEESEHFLARVVGAETKWAAAALRLAEAAHAGYLSRFGFRDISKVPGKKVRILIDVDPTLARDRLYFHPTPLYHSELRFEMPDAKLLTLEGRRRIVYGFCHELGHMVAMWGQHGVVEDDKHAWAHYTGCLIVEEVYERLGNEPWPTWTAFQRRASGKTRLLGQIEGQTPGTASYEAILALFHAAGEELGTEIYGKAWTWLEEKRRFRRINNVPYLWLRDLRDALLAVAPPEKRTRVAEIFAE